jgi:hypothetical protein
VGQNCYINIANGSAENVEMLKYLERTLKIQIAFTKNLEGD